MILNLIKSVCKENKNKVFYKVNNDYITYGDLWIKANELASKIPINYKGPIIVYGNKEIEVLVAFVACLLSGNEYISVNDSIPKNRVLKIIDSSKSKYVINCMNKPFCYLSDIKKLNKGTSKYSDNINDGAYIIYTSGSSGTPKGVLVTKKNLNNFINWINKVISKKDILVVLNQANFSFDLSVCDIYFSISNGLKLVGLETSDVIGIYDVFYNEKVNLAVITPTFAKLCLSDKRFNKENLSHLKTLFFCGERLEKSTVLKLLDRFPNIEIINAYGPTEATCAVSAVKIMKNHFTYDILPVGTMDSNAVNIMIKDKEIILEGNSVSKGYINIESSNFYKNKNICGYKTGDIGYIKDGYLFCEGRIDNQIKYKGYRIEIEEIEEALNNISEVNDSLVTINTNDEGKVNSICAYVSLNKNISKEMIKEKLKDNIPEYMIPKIIKIVDEIKTNSNFKKERKEISYV